jgi:spore germination protein YaaH
MVKFTAFALFLLATIGLIFYQHTLRKQSDIPTQGNNKTLKEFITEPTPTPKLIKKTSIFVPYWAKFDEVEVGDYDTAIYFGVAPSSSGTIIHDAGYSNLSSFVNATSGKRRYLTVRMLDADSNKEIVHSSQTTARKKVIDESIKLAKENGFDGIVLDLEMGVLPFDDVVADITSFVSDFSSMAKAEQLHFAMTIYGDTAYRKRPYDLAALSGHVDEMMVMAYDFHKSRGEPGPNFPLQGKEKYGYDYEQLLSDLSVVPKDKLTFIFGMYGYDWMVDEKKKPIRPAKAMSLKDINKEFVTHCEWKNCLVLRDEKAGENEVDYIDNNLYYHIVWFEDVESMSRKREFLEKNGIGSVSFWVYGHF